MGLCTISGWALAASFFIEVASSSSCRVIPGDDTWPRDSDWADLNSTVGGRLIETVPVGSVCHTAGISRYDEAECKHLSDPVEGAPEYGDTVQTYWDAGETFTGSPADVMNAYYQNQTCDPFTPTEKPCELGNLAVYSINVTNADDVIAGIEFAKEHNVRIAVKNSGHDYTGKSSGQGSLGLWTQNLKTQEVIPNYNRTSYSGPAIKLGAGVSVGEAMLAVKNEYRVVGGECGTVGISGGYTQGAGHSILNSAYGLGADQVLEWEVVTGEGEYVIATEEENSDLYWAMSGGGGSSYGVALSMTSKIYPEGPVASASFVFDNTGVDNATYWDAIERWFQYLPSIVSDSKNTIQFVIWHDRMAALSINLIDQEVDEVDRLVGPFFEELEDMGITYNLTTLGSETYFDHFDHYFGPVPHGSQPASTLLSSRLVPKNVVEDDEATTKLVDAFRLTVETGEFLVGCTAMDADVAHPDNAVLPAWRDTIGICIMNAFWNYTAPLEQNLEVKIRMNEVYQAAVEEATPDSGVYLNEIDPFYVGDWKQSMYGANYDRLLDIKHQYDPDNVFYGHFAVGSDEFSIDGSGRLCYDGSETS